MSFFERNIVLLEKTQPELAQRLSEITVPADRYEVSPTRIDKPTVLATSVTGQRVLLGSRHDPWKEAFRWAESHQAEPIYNACFLGGGMWYHVLALIHGAQGTIGDVVVIDHDANLARLALEHVDITQMLGNPHLHWFVEPDEATLRESTKGLLTNLALDSVKLVSHEPTVRLNPQAYKATQETLEETIRNTEILLRTKSVLGPVIQENVLTNLPALFTHPGASILTGQFQSVPAYIVGAGPSLDRNIDDLADVGERGLIFAVDTSYPVLRNRGISAHVNVTCDPTNYNLAHFARYPDLGDSLLVYSPSVRPEIVERVKGRKTSLPLPTSRTLLRLKDALGLPIYMKPGINVVQATFNLARLWGCDPIVFVGVDLSFNPRGGSTHATGSALSRTIRALPGTDKMSVELLDTDEEEEFSPIMTPGNEQPQVATSEFWLAYLRSLEGDIEEFPGRVINATAGGALIRGAEYRKLADAVAELSMQDVNPSMRISNALDLFVPPEPDILQEFLENGMQWMENAAKACDEGLEIVAQLERETQDPKPERAQAIGQLVEDINRVHNEVVQEHKIYAVLDEAADHILQPFMQRANRPIGNPLLISNLKKTATRFQTYFSKMQRLCRDTTRILEETRERLPSAPPEPPPSADDFFGA